MIEVLIVNQSEVPRLLPVKECVDVMARAFAALSRGEAEMPIRQILWLPERTGAMALMPAYLTGMAALGLKAVTFFPRNEGTDLDSHQGVVLALRGRDGAPPRDDRRDRDHRRSARPRSAALATRLLAREDAGDLALVGSGVQARTHLEAMLAVRKLRRVRVASKTLARAKRFAEREGKRHGIAIEPLRLGARGRRRRGPRLHGDVLARAGPSRRMALARRARQRRRLERRRRRASSTRTPSALAPLRRPSRIGAERGRRLPDRPQRGRDHRRAHPRRARRAPARARPAAARSPEEITLFKSLGLAVEDLAAAQHIDAKARAAGHRHVRRRSAAGRHDAD